MTSAIAWARERNACMHACDWLRLNGPLTCDEAWERCDNLDWLFWVLDVVRHVNEAAAERAYRLFACDCAERALEGERRAGRKPDAWCWRAVEVARRYAWGQATLVELVDTRTDVWAGARVGFYPPAARAAAYATSFMSPAAAHATALAAAHAARSAASTWKLAWDAERRWQVKKLKRYFKPTGYKR